VHFRAALIHLSTFEARPGKVLASAMTATVRDPLVSNSKSTHLMHSRRPLTSVRKACGDMETSSSVGSTQDAAKGTCPRCGHSITQTGRGRPRTWCSQSCRRAAYEERRAAASGAVALRVIRHTMIEEHPLGVCVDRTIASPAGCRRVVLELTRLTLAGAVRTDPRWSSTYSALEGLVTALRPPATRRW
jgi:hypothetical protein